MARVYDALKRVEEERTIQERSRRLEAHKNEKSNQADAKWSAWFRRRRPPLRAQATPDHHVLERLDRLAIDVEAVRVSRKTISTDLDSRVEALQAQIGRLESHVADIEESLTSAVKVASDASMLRSSQLNNRILLFAALSILALVVALTRA